MHKISQSITILLVEDNPADAMLVSEAIDNMGIHELHVKHVTRLADATQNLQQNDIDVVLLDLILPDSQGLATLSALLPFSSERPILVLSGLHDEGLALNALKLGAQDYLIKGEASSKNLESSLRKAIERQRLVQTLTAKEARIRDIIDKNSDGIVVVDDEGVIRFANPAAAKLFSRPAGELVGIPFGFPVTGIERTEVEILQGKGATISVELQTVNFEWENQPALLVSLRDVTERKLAEEKIRLIVESAPNAILLVDETRKLRLVNTQAERYFGYKRDELIGMNIEQLVPDRFRQAHTQYQVDFMTTLESRPMGVGHDLYGVRKDGDEFPVEVGLAPLELRGEALIIVTVIDISERKRAEEQIQHQLKRLNALHMIDIAIASNSDQNVVLNLVLQYTMSMLSVDACAILIFNTQLQTVEYVASRGFYSNILSRVQLKSMEGYAGQVILERKIIHVSDFMKRHNKLTQPLPFQDEAFVDYYGAPLIVKGEIKGVLEVYHRSYLRADAEWLDFLDTLAGQTAIAVDNTQLFENLQHINMQLEQRISERTVELKQTNQELEHANRAKDEFLANMSHELRTPLTSILGLTESLLEQRQGRLNDYQQKSLEIVETSGQHLLELINDILDLSKIEAGKFDFYPQPINVDETCRSSLSFIKSMAANKGIKITYIQDLTVSKILADPRRIKQILINLLTNAIKFTPNNGEITLKVNINVELDLIQFSVSDNGIGISYEDMQKLFQPFVQVDSGLDRMYEGTGLGLALVQRLADLHGGSVHVESEPGKGSRFTVNLPCLHEEAIRLEKLSEPHSAAITKPGDTTLDMKNMSTERGTILLADDNLPSILTIGEYLESYNYKVITAHDGLEAVEQAEKYAPDLILMDVQMPSLDGLEATRRLRSNPKFTSIPIIALTALAMPGDRERCIEAGASEYITKPVSLKSLVKAIDGLLQTHNPNARMS